MFGYVIDLSEVKAAAQRLVDANYRVFAGLAFMVLAMASIQYDEFIAPEMARLSDGWSTAATDFSKRLTSFTL